MTVPRSARLELRVTPAQKELIVRGASLCGKTITEYAVDVLVGAALQEAVSYDASQSSLGWMRGTATIVGDITHPTEPEGWEPGDFPQ